MLAYSRDEGINTNGDDDLAYHQVFFFGNTRSLAVTGLFGCTCIVAVSKRGAWVCHLWEIPLFTHHDDDENPPSGLEQAKTFHNGAIVPLRRELMRLRTEPVYHNSTYYFMGDDTDPHIFILVPYLRTEIGAIDYSNEFPTTVPEAWGHEQMGVGSMNQKIKDAIKDVFGRTGNQPVSCEKVLYAPMRRKVPEIGEPLGDRK